MGGLGLVSASHLATPAYWASWADALPVLHCQAPQVTTTILHLFEQFATAPPHIQAAHAARQTIFEHGWEPPSWQQLTVQQPPPARAQIFAGPTQPGWQQHAAAPINIAAREGIHSSLDPGRWSHEGTNFIRLLAQSEAREAPALLQRSVMAALISRWSAMFSHAAMQSFAPSLLDQNLSTACPPTAMLMATHHPSANSTRKPRHQPPGNSRLPPS